jgi:hypothetical protein
MLRCLFIVASILSLKLLDHDPQVRLASLEETEIIYGKSERGAVGRPSFLGSPSALTDCFTSSNLLLIRSVISDKCGRRHAERGLPAHVGGSQCTQVGP